MNQQQYANMKYLTICQTLGDYYLKLKKLNQEIEKLEMEAEHLSKFIEHSANYKQQEVNNDEG